MIPIDYREQIYYVRCKYHDEVFAKSPNPNIPKCIYFEEGTTGLCKHYNSVYKECMYHLDIFGNDIHTIESKARVYTLEEKDAARMRMEDGIYG